MKKYPDHNSEIVPLKRVEGQIRGIQRMIVDGQYCVDILNQIQAVIGALGKVEYNILARHMEQCVTSAVKKRSPLERQKKFDELLKLIKRFRKR